MNVSNMLLFDEALKIKDTFAREQLEKIPREYVSVLEYGADNTGNDDSTVAIQRAIDDCTANKKNLYLPAGTYKITSLLTIGNGSPTTQSTVHNFEMMGAGAGLDGLSFADSKKTVLKWAGVSGGTMMQVRGPILRINISDIEFACNSLADTALKVIHAAYSTFTRLSATYYRGTAFITTTDNDDQPPGVVYGCASNVWYQLVAASPLSTGCGLLCDGGAGIFNTARNMFIEPELSFGDAPSTYGIKLRYADHNYFIGGDCYTSGSGYGCLLERDPGHKQFPSNNSFFAVALVNGVSGVSGETSTNGQEGINFFFNYPQADGEPLPTINGVSFTTYNGDLYQNSVKRLTMANYKTKNGANKTVNTTGYTIVDGNDYNIYNYLKESAIVEFSVNVTVPDSAALTCCVTIDDYPITDSEIVFNASGSYYFKKYVFLGQNKTSKISFKAKNTGAACTIKNYYFGCYILG